MLKKGVIAYGLLIAILSFVLVASSNMAVYSQSQHQWIVDKSGKADFTNIQGAVNAANAGDFIFVNNGDYTEHIIINKENLKIYGYGAVVSGGFTIESDNVFLSGFTINGNSQSTGILLDNINACYVSNNTVSSSSIGILVNQSPPSTGSYAQNNIIGNKILNNAYGIKFCYNFTSPPNKIYGNNIFDNVISDNTHATYSEWNINSVEADGQNITFSQNKVSNNLFRNNENTFEIYGNIDSLNTYNAVSLSFSDGIYNNNFLSTVKVSAKFNVNTWNLDDFGGKTITYGSVNVGTIPHLNTLGPWWGYVTDYWDNGTAGNYWSNYEGTDSNNDNIGDTAYTVSINTIDRYPLMAMASQESSPLVPDWAIPPSQTSTSNATPDYLLIIAIITSVAVAASVSVLMLKRKQQLKLGRENRHE